MLVTVVPLRAYALLADAQKVSMLYFAPGRSASAAALGFLIWCRVPVLALQMFSDASVTICLNPMFSTTCQKRT